MLKASRWLKSLLFGRGGKEKERCSKKLSSTEVETATSSTSLPVPKEKKRWSFRRSRNAGKDSKCLEVSSCCVQVEGNLDPHADKKNVMAVEAVSTAVSDAPIADNLIPTEIMLPITIAGSSEIDAVRVVASAIKIQAVFRAFLARKALSALKGLVKLQALVRGHLVRKHASDTLRQMEALVALQARTRKQRIKMLLKAQSSSHWQQQRERTWLHYYKESNEMGSSTEENIKIVEMDHGELHTNLKRGDDLSSEQSQTSERYQENFQARTPAKVLQFREHASPTPSVLTDMSPRTFSGRYEEFSFIKVENHRNQNTQQKLYGAIHVSERSSLVEPRNDSFFFPSYMANTESSRAKVRSQSAPKQRPPETFEKQTSRRRVSIEGRNIPRSARMLRSISSTSNGYHYPNSIKLDRSNTSFVSSECGSSSTMLTNTRY